MKLVSILLPCFNHEKFVDDCLNSLCEQTYENIEVIITDDCSKDNSFEILQSWQERLEKRFARAEIRKNPENQGVVKTFNSMLRDCRGDYIKCLATDDMLLPDAIEKMVAYAEKTDCDILYSNVYFFDENLHYPIREHTKLEPFYQQMQPSGKNLTGRLCAHNFVCAPGVLIPRKTLDTYGFFDERYSMEDFPYWLRVSVEGSFAYMNEKTALYRRNSNSMSHFTLNEVHIRRHRAFFEQIHGIYMQYVQYATDAQQAEFYNGELSTTIGLNDKALAAEIYRTMRESQLAISVFNRFRMILLKTNLYIYFKKCKQLLKRK